MLLAGWLSCLHLFMRLVLFNCLIHIDVLLSVYSSETAFLYDVCVIANFAPEYEQ